MTPPVFAHGHLRLYLLSLLEDQPRHGYELIQALSERFDGTYSPSAGTIYPRLAKLEEEGLVTKHNDGRKSVYRITEAGRRELDSRREELASIEQDVDSSVRRLAADVRHGLASAREELRAEFARLAQELGPDARAGFEKAASAGAAGAASARGFFAGAAKGWNEPRENPSSMPDDTPPGFVPTGFSGHNAGEPRPQDPPQAPPSPQTPEAPQAPEVPGAPTASGAEHRTHGRYDTWASASSSHVWNSGQGTAGGSSGNAPTDVPANSNAGGASASATGGSDGAPQTGGNSGDRPGGQQGANHGDKPGDKHGDRHGDKAQNEAMQAQFEALSRADLVLSKFRHELRQELRTAQSQQRLSPGLVSFLDQELERVRERVTHALEPRAEKDASGS